MNLFAISDLHIFGPNDPLYFSLISILQDRACPGDVVVLAGDVFDLFVGDKDIFRERYASFLKAVETAGQTGVEIHYIEGNHDFFMQKVFHGMKGVQFHAHDVSLAVGGKNFFFAHGDTANRSDYGYLALRFVLRSWAMKAFIFVVPGKWIDWIGRTSSKQSRAATSGHWANGNLENLRRTYRSYAAEHLAKGADFVVLGHCHDLDEMTFNVGGRFGQYINIGYPRVHGSFLSWSPGEEKILREKLPRS